jgi:pantoate--beta-alanine ligase
VVDGARNYEVLQQQAHAALTHWGWAVDYVSICNQSDLQPATLAARELVILAAAKLGKTRLLDNVEVHI